MAGDAMDSMAAGTIEGSATYNDALGSITDPAMGSVKVTYF